MLLRDANTAEQYANEIISSLRYTYDHVLRHLDISRKRMQQQYNKGLRYIDYSAGEKVLMKMKYYMTGESRKLSPRRSGPWTILEKLPKGVNFRIRNDSNKQEKIVKICKRSLGLIEQI